MADTISIPNWRRFQHYGKEKPPWIKLYRDTLQNYEIMHRLEPNERWVLLGLWMLAAAHGNAIPEDYDFLSHELRETVTPKMVHKMQTLGMIELGAASRECLDKAYAKTEEETEEETEKKPADGDVLDVFDYWVATRKAALNLNGGPQPVLSAKRSSKIKARLREGYDVGSLKLAIDGCAGSEFHREGGHMDIELICRDQQHVEQFLHRQRTAKAQPGATKRGNLQGWTP